MSAISRQQLLVFVCLLFCLGGLVGVTGANSGYELLSDQTIETPEETVEVDDIEFTIDSLVVVSHGESIEVQTTTPSEDDRPRVNLERVTEDGNPDRIKTTLIRGSEDVEFTTDDLDPGTYVITMSDGGYQDILPVVIAGYDVAVDHPTTADRESFELTIETSSITTTDELTTAEVVLWSEDENYSQTVDVDSDKTVTTTINTAEIPSGEYQIYTAVRSDQVVYGGQQEILGVSEPSTITVDSETDGTETPTETDTPTETETETPTETEETPTETDTPTETETTPSPTTETETETEAGDDDRDTVITPNPTETESDDDSASDTHTSTPSQTDDTTPLPVWLSIGGLLLLALLAARPIDRDHKKQ
ncbi:hypothetical protein HUB97_06995 [Halorubraceae archaeon YAN]|nr:hypothetical protein [Halorubraceae archaeon YAN]